MSSRWATISLTAHAAPDAAPPAAKRPRSVSPQSRTNRDATADAATAIYKSRAVDDSDILAPGWVDDQDWKSCTHWVNGDTALLFKLLHTAEDGKRLYELKGFGSRVQRGQGTDLLKEQQTLNRPEIPTF